MIGIFQSFWLPRWVAIVLCLTPGLVQAVSNSLFSSRTWQTDDGLPHNTVQALAQTADGYLWIGTRDGLARFDGMRFTVFEPRNTPELKGRIITALRTTRDGRLWIGSDDGGVTCLRDGKFSHYDKADGLPGIRVRAFFEDDSGTLWVGLIEGLYRFQNGKFVHVLGTEEFPFHSVINMGPTRDHRFWMVTDLGLCACAGGTFSALGLNGNRTNKMLRAACIDRNNNLWLGTMVGLGLNKDGAFTLFNRTKGLPNNSVSLVTEDSASDLWIGTSIGLFRFADNQFIPELSNEGESYGLIHAILEDREGNLWIGSKEGLTRLRRKQFFTYSLPQGLTNDNVMSVYENKAGVLWIGTWGGGLYRWNDGKLNSFSHSSLSSDFILATLETSDGSLWVGADFDGGIYRFQGEKVTRYWNGEYEVHDAAIKVLHEDKKGNLWIGTRTALLRLHNYQMSRYTTADGLAGNLVQTICEAHDGTIWIGTLGGVSCFRDDKLFLWPGTAGLSDTNITTIHEDSNSALWIGTRNGGLNYSVNAKSKAISTKEGLFDNGVLEMVEDDYGWTWMTSLKGIFKARKSDLESYFTGKRMQVSCISYDRTDGLASTQCNGVAKPCVCKSRDGRLWFATTKGLATTDPATGTKTNSAQPTVIIEDFSADNKRVEISISKMTASSLNIPPGRGELEFQYTAPNLSAPEKTQFKYKLDGVDQDWVDARTRRLVHYNNLSPGEYRFQVIASGTGDLRDSTASISFVLLPHFWQTRWFLLLSATLSIITLGGTVRYFTWRKAQTQLRWLEQQHALERERGRIAKDMHDDLGANLTQITLLSELAKRDLCSPEKVVQHIDRISGTARDLVLGMNEIVWAVNPQNDNLRKLAGYIFQYSEKFLTLAGIRCRMDRPFSLPERPVTSEVRHNLFLVVKEALHNIVKHSGATEVWLGLEIDDAKLTITVKDNGCGFNAAQIPAFGNGLQNMKQRMEEIGGNFTLTNEPGHGTKIVLSTALKFQPKLPKNSASNLKDSKSVAGNQV